MGTKIEGLAPLGGDEATPEEREQIAELQRRETGARRFDVLIPPAKTVSEKASDPVERILRNARQRLEGVDSQNTKE